MLEAGVHVTSTQPALRTIENLVSVIVPTLNEVDNIDLILAAILKEAGPELIVEVLVADGGSKDGTVDRVLSWQQKAPVELVTGDGRSGLSGDVLNAAQQARGSIIIVMDADLSHPTTCIPNLVAPIRAGTSDMVVGSRYVEGGSVPDWPFQRREQRAQGIPGAFQVDEGDCGSAVKAEGKRQKAEGKTKTCPL